MRWHPRYNTYAPMEEAEVTANASTHTNIKRMVIHCPSYVSEEWYKVTMTTLPHFETVQAEEVLEAVYRAYRVPLSPACLDKYKDLVASEAFTKAYQWRIANSPNPVEEVGEGPTRVDLLCGRTIFGGLEYMGNDHWKVRELAMCDLT